MKPLLLGAVMLALSACAPATTTNLTASNLEVAPLVKVEVALDATMADKQTFAVVPLSVISDKAKATGLTAQHLAFQARNYMEMLGYRYVERREDADLEVWVDASNEYSETTVSPSQYTVPVYVPAQTSTYSANSSGSFSGSSWGSYYGTTTGTVTVPGYYTSRTYTTPGYTRGSFHPAVSVLIYDAKTQKQQVMGGAVGTSSNPDVRVSDQNLLYQMFTKVPFSKMAVNPTRSGQIGLYYGAWTADGNAYYLTVFDTVKDLPAARAGLRVGDFILSIDGQSTLNKPQSELDRLVAADAGQERTLVVNRGEETMTVKLVMAPRT